MAEEPLYYAKEPGPKNGRIGTVWKRSVSVDNGDGTANVTMGFKVCDCNEYVEGAATIIADALNRLPLLEDAAEDLLIGIGMGWDLEGLMEGTQALLPKMKVADA